MLKAPKSQNHNFIVTEYILKTSTFVCLYLIVKTLKVLIVSIARYFQYYNYIFKLILSGECVNIECLLIEKAVSGDDFIITVYRRC